MKTMYKGYIQKMCMKQQGEIYHIGPAADDYEDWEDFDNLEDAKAWAIAKAKEMRDSGDDHTVYHTRHGLDYIEYHDYGVVPFFPYEDEIEFDYDNDEVFETIPEDVRKAAEESVRSYHRFLDFEDDEYFGVE